LTAEENRAAARSMLALALKSGKADELALTTPLRRPEFTSTLDEVVAKVKEGNSLLKTIAIQRDLAATKRRADRADYLPQLFLFGRFHLLTKDLSVLDPHWTVGAQLRLNLFSGGEKLFKMKADSALVREVEEKGREASDKLEKACDGLYHQAQVQRHLLDSFPVRLADAEENARLAESRFSSGLGISLEVVDANLLLEKVKMERLSALYNYNMVLLQLKLLQQDVDSWIGKLEEAS
ncbi:MAG TPA: TolC family protein, partial [Candidatus Aminicenantes bacterium]|nr:TolC family protein [Candidatus Aminicenantes bacterium]